MFKYEVAFSRNLGWVTQQEQEILRNTCVAIGGLGGVGGSHLICLARMGFTKFHIADLDTYDHSNFNRQEGATIETLGLPKVEVAAAYVKKINPEIEVKIFHEGVNEDCIEEFLDGVDVYVDSLDIFAVQARRLTFETCHKKGIPAFTCAPLAMGAAFLCFTKDSMSFSEYFGMKDPEPEKLKSLEKDSVALYMYRLQVFAENILKFIGGVAPSAMQRHYLVDPSKVDFFRKDLPSLKPGIDLAAGVMASNLLKYLLKRGSVLTAPHAIHYDTYLNKTIKTWRPFGHKNPLMALVRYIIKKKVRLEHKYEVAKARVQKQFEEGRLKPNASDKELYHLLSED